MSEKANPIQRLLLWLSGAPTGPEPPAAPALVEPSLTEPIEPPEFTELPAAAPAAEPASSSIASNAVQPETPIMTNDLVNDASAYGVTIVPVEAAPGAAYWRVIRVHHLTPDENHGNHNIYLDALDEAGGRAFGAQARVTWPDGEQTLTIEKPLNEPGANFPMWKWQICAVEMLGLPSDRVENLHTGHPDEPPGLGNTLFHHSFEAVFQRTVKGAIQPPAPPSGDPFIERYVLFGPPASSRTTVYLDLARGYLLARQPTFGFDANAASHARQVVIVGEAQDVSQEIEHALQQAGCQVQRVQGTPEQVAAALRSLQSSQVFVPMAPISPVND